MINSEYINKFLVIIFSSLALIHLFFDFSPALSAIAKGICEISLLIMGIADLRKSRSLTNWLILILIVCVILIRIIIVIAHNMPLNILSFKFLVTSTLLLIIFGRKFENYEMNRKIFAPWRYVMFLVIIVYLIEFFLDLDPTRVRAYAWTENNFELIFFIILSTVYVGVNRNYLVGLHILTLVSMSRSALLALLIRDFIRNKAKGFITYFGISIFILLVVFIFSVRIGSGGIQSIDRYQFSLVYLNYALDASWWKILLGNVEPLTAMYCEPLSRYKQFFYSSGECGSQVLHSLILRTLYDIGIVGIFLLFTITLKLLLNLRSFLSPWSLFMIGAVSGLSISGYANAFYLLGLLIVRLSLVQKL